MSELIYQSTHTGAEIDEAISKVPNLEQQINDLDADKANKAQEAWITATLLNGWGGELKYAKSDLGIVTVTMTCTPGTVAGLTDIAILPVGYRPVVRTIFPIFKPSEGSKAQGDLYVHTDGRIKIMSDAGLINTVTNYGSQTSFYAG